MVGVEFRFPGGRYHATPWDQHVNEGVVEWPPSPWRLARALVATWHRKHAGEVELEDLRLLVEQLTASPPRYRLPRTVASHTRHYMPTFDGAKTKVFDAFLHLDPAEPLLVVWPAAVVEGRQRDSLARLVERLGYLGRAESWVEGRLVSAPPAECNVLPVGDVDGPAAGDGSTVTRLLAPMKANSYASWRHAAIEERKSEKTAASTKRQASGNPVRLSPRETAAIEAELPADLLSALEADTGSLRAAGWNRPPGSETLSYLLPGGLQQLAPAARARSTRAGAPTVARFAVAGAVPPRLTEALSLGERVRVALMSRSGGASVFSGHDQAGRPSLGHDHAYILAEAARRRAFVSHITLFARMGLDGAARGALDGLTGVWGRTGHDLKLVLLGVGQPESFSGLDEEAGQCPLLAASRDWVSRTPFVPTRHPKRYRDGRPKVDAEGLAIGSPEHDLRRLLAAAAFPQPQAVEAIDGTQLGGKLVRWLEFETQRRSGGGRRGARVGTGFRLRFEEPVRGPIALGYGAHLGLGVFIPAEVPEARR